MSSAEQQARDKAVARRDQLTAWELENAAKQYGAVGDLVRELAHFGAGGTVSNPVRLVKDSVAELCRLRAQETRIRALGRAWIDSAGVTPHKVSKAFGEAILAALDTEEGQA